MEWGGRLVSQGGKQPEEKPAVSKKKKREGLTPVVQNTKKISGTGKRVTCK